MLNELLNKYPRQLALFAFGVLVLAAYMVALFNHLEAGDLRALLATVGGGLVAELTGARQAQHIDVDRIERARIESSAPEK